MQKTSYFLLTETSKKIQMKELNPNTYENISEKTLRFSGICDDLGESIKVVSLQKKTPISRGLSRIY